MSSVFKKVENYQGYIFAFFIFILFSTIVFHSNIHGDGKIHSLIAKESIESGKLVQHAPYLIYNFDSNKRIYVPIAYPLMSESVFSLFYLIAGDVGLKLYSPLIATAIFILLYLCIKEIGKYEASLVALIVTLAISERLVMTPLIEPYLVLSLLSGVFLIKKYLDTNEQRYLYLSAFFIGIAGVTKQSGLLPALSITFFIFLFLIHRIIKGRETLAIGLKKFFVFLGIFLAVISFGLFNQINRTGTIAFAPGGIKISESVPFHNVFESLLQSKFKSKPEALKARNELISYSIKNRNLVETLQSYILSPFLFYRSDAISGKFETYKLLANLIIILIIITLIKRSEYIKNNKAFILLLLFLFFEEIIVSYIFRSPVHQYQIFGITIAVLLISLMILEITKKSNFFRLALVLPLIILFVYGYYTLAVPLWTAVGREDDYHLEGYRRVGEFVQDNIPKDSIFLASETMFRYYAKRDTIMMNEGVGDVFQKIINSTDQDEVLKDLKSLNIDYIVIDKSQIKRKGLYDYLPPSGLVSIIDSTEKFTNIFDPYNDGEIVIYKVNYNYYE